MTASLIFIIFCLIMDAFINNNYFFVKIIKFHIFLVNNNIAFTTNFEKLYKKIHLKNNSIKNEL